MTFSFKKWMESEAADFAEYNLQKKYDHYNALLFGGELPTIPIEFAKLKSMGGVVHCVVVMDPQNMPNPRLVRMGLQDKYQGAKIEEGTHRMQISNVFKKSEQGLDAILIHEMIHVYFNHTGQFGEQHGMKFSKMARVLGEKVGFEIPLTDNIEKLGLADDIKLKPVGVHLLTKKDGYSIALMSDKNMQANLEGLIARWTDMVKYNYALKAQCFIINSVKWTGMANTYPLQRRQPKDLGYYPLKDTEALQELLEKGQLLSSIPA